VLCGRAVAGLMPAQALRVGPTVAAGLALAGVFWLTFSGPFPLSEFCSRNRPTWVFGLFDAPRYTAITGPVFLASLLALNGLYLGALWLAARTGGRAAAVVLLIALPSLSVAVLLPGYPLLSNDLFKYVFDGRIMTVYGENPFLHVPADFPDDRFYDLVYWKAAVNAHGPIWRVLEAASAEVGSERCVDAILAMKVWPTLAYLATIGVLYFLLRSICPNRALTGTLAYAWCPLVLLEAVQNGHNDVVAALPVLLAVWAAQSGRWRLAIVLVAVGFLVKPLAAVAGPILLVAAWRAGPSARREAVTGIALAAVMVVGAYAPFFGGLSTFQGLDRGSIFSASPAELLVIALEGVGWPLDRAMTVARVLSVGAFVALALLQLWGVWRGRLPVASAVAGVLFAYLVVGSQWFNPWYLLWLMPLAIVAPDRRIRVLALAFATLAPLTYLLQYDARLVVPLVFVPIGVLAVRYRTSLGWPPGSALALPETVGTPRVAGHG
jgi:Glycosyltransferase family 87